MRTLTLSALVVAALFVAGCGGSGPAADEGKSKEQVRTEAGEMDQPALEKMVADYQKVIADKVKEKADMLAEKGADLLKGAGEQVSALEKEINNLKERLQIYLSELDKKKK